VRPLTGPQLLLAGLAALVAALAAGLFIVRRRRRAALHAATRRADRQTPDIHVPDDPRTAAAPVLLCNGRTSSATEAFRAIRTQIIIMMRQRKLRHLVITSTGPGEGKSTIAANLALVTARAGHRVLLVDADLHRPQLHDIFAVANTPGLAELLQDADRQTIDAALLQRFCQPSGIPNLQLLPAGHLGVDGAEIFAGESMRAAVATFASEYELVIYDSPPVLSVADPTVLAAFADGVLLIVRAGRYPRDAIQQAYAVLEGVQAKLIGAILNGVDATTGEYGGYSGYYRYPYPEP
jgi:capsular exopolysaccharide synthesis family protein